jgi:hypothetical protein
MVYRGTWRGRIGIRVHGISHDCALHRSVGRSIAAAPIQADQRLLIDLLFQAKGFAQTTGNSRQKRRASPSFDEIASLEFTVTVLTYQHFRQIALLRSAMDCSWI